MNTASAGVPLCLLGIVCAFFVRLYAADTTLTAFPQRGEYAYDNKLIFTESPGIGTKWRFGIRTSDILIWSAFLNIADQAAIDALVAGIPHISMDDSGELADNFSLLTLKSKPCVRHLGDLRYRIGGGMQWYHGVFFIDEPGDDSAPQHEQDHALALFATQDAAVGTRHVFNLYTSVAPAQLQWGTDVYETGLTYYIVPGYRRFWGARLQWSVAVEYFMFNSARLPIKVVQVLFDPDHMTLENRDQRMLSFMFWGIQYATPHWRFDAGMAHHISFQYIILPMVSVGWAF
jgi:hypothetical protein